MRDWWWLALDPTQADPINTTAVYRDDPDWVFAMVYQRMFDHAESKNRIEDCYPHSNIEFEESQSLLEWERIQLQHRFFNRNVL